VGLGSGDAVSQKALVAAVPVTSMVAYPMEAMTVMLLEPKRAGGTAVHMTLLNLIFI